MAIKREKIQPEGIHVRMVGGPGGVHPGRHRQRHRQDDLCRRPIGAQRGRGLVGKGDMRAQIEQVGENIKTCLEAAGATLADIVKTNTFVTNYEEFAKHPDMRMRYFGPATPTSTTVEISRLADPDAMIEIEAIAVIDG